MMFVVFYISLIVVALGLANFIAGSINLIVGLLPKRKEPPLRVKARANVKPLPFKWWED